MQEQKTRLDGEWNPVTTLGSRHTTLLDALFVNIYYNALDTKTEFKEAVTFRDRSNEFLESTRKFNFSMHYRNGIRVLRKNFHGNFLDRILGKSKEGRTESESLKIFLDLEMAKDNTEAKGIIDYLVRENVLASYSDQSKTFYKLATYV